MRLMLLSRYAPAACARPDRGRACGAVDLALGTDDACRSLVCGAVLGRSDRLAEGGSARPDVVGSWSDGVVGGWRGGLRGPGSPRRGAGACSVASSLRILPAPRRCVNRSTRHRYHLEGTLQRASPPASICRLGGRCGARLRHADYQPEQRNAPRDVVRISPRSDFIATTRS